MHEEQLKAVLGVPGIGHLSSWRGFSGARYVVGIHRFEEAELLDIAEAVVMGVRRGRDGEAEIVDARDAGPEALESVRRHWFARLAAFGANELHVHRLARDAASRRAIVADLKGSRGRRTVN